MNFNFCARVGAWYILLLRAWNGQYKTELKILFLCDGCYIVLLCE
jgi:hypothetical protein